MEYIFGILIIIVVVWVLFVGVGVEIAPKEKEKRKNDEEYVPGMYSAPMKMPEIQPDSRYVELMETIIRLQAHPKASLHWEEHRGWRVQFDGEEKLYGGGLPFSSVVSGALFEHDMLEKDPERYSMSNYCAPLPPDPKITPPHVRL